MKDSLEDTSTKNVNKENVSSEDNCSEENTKEKISNNKDVLDSNGSLGTQTHEDKVDETKLEIDGQDDKQSSLENKIEELENLLAKAKDQELRNIAEMENIRLRMFREQQRKIDHIRGQILTPFLSFNDDLLRMCESMLSSDVSKEFATGVKLLIKKMEEIFAQYGIKCVNKVDIPFDINRHEIILSQPDANKEPNTVLQVVENGYVRNDHVIRYAKVIVSTAIDSSECNKSNEK